MILIPVHGTWALRENRAWWKHGSDFHLQAVRNNFKYPEEIFYWSSDVNGIGLASLFGIKTDYNDWDAGAFSLAQYLKHFTYLERNLIGHSHALQLVLRCKIPINRFISVGSPIRNETNTIEHRLHINKWMHIFEKGFDKMQWLGQLGDGRFGGGIKAIYADRNEPIEGISHSKILKDAETMKLWETKKWYKFLSGELDGD